MNPMVKLYVSLVEKGAYTIEQVPEKLRAEVKKALDSKNQQQKA